MLFIALLLCCITSSVIGYALQSSTMLGSRDDSTSTNSPPASKPTSTPVLVAASTTTPTTTPTAKPAVTTKPPSACNVTACNNQMKDYIFNKYWAFANSAAQFPECARCPSRWFKATSANNNHTMTSNDGTNWTTNDDVRALTKSRAFDQVKLT